MRREPKRAYQIKIGDLYNGWEDGWLRVVNIKKEFGTITIILSNGKSVYFPNKYKYCEEII